MRAKWCTLGELHTVLSLEDVADAHDYLIANEEAEAELHRRRAERTKQG